MVKCVACGIDLANGVRFCSSVRRGPWGDTDDVATIDFSTVTSPLPPSQKTPSQKGSRPPSSSSSRPPSSADYLINEGRFLPGRLIAGRYRIIALLGKGGMGEVYRADDLTLGQQVAVKFLPDEAASDEGLLERFRNEVRMARRVSHPNVCRVYDVGEVDGQTFYTMEYVDGEDLSSLLRRIGRLPQDKAIEIARQLCAGLAAAHTKGVLHRDLKPANIMLDGRGQAVIMDFGLAGISDDIRGAEIRSGTPAYMAPEQLAGQEVSPRSDLYSLGLVLYEVFTGKRTFEKVGERTAAVLHGHADRTPSRPSSVVKDLDPAVEKVILRCMESSPTARPANALAVAAALPGGDPLAAALAAGETPSPQLVAASGETTGLRPRIAVAILAATLLGLSIGTYLTIRYSALEKMHLEQTPEVLAQKARETVTHLGYPEKPADTAFGFSYDTNFRDSVEKDADKNPPNWDEISLGRPTLLNFWYRQSPDLMAASDFRDVLMVPRNCYRRRSRNHSVGDDQFEARCARSAGFIFRRFLRRKIGRSGRERAAGIGALCSLPQNWTHQNFQQASPQWTSLGTADARAAWTGVWPGSTRPLRVEAAAWHGKPVFFAMIGDWNKPWRMIAPRSADEQKDRIGDIIGLALLIAGVWSPLHCWRASQLPPCCRGDHEGAWRLAQA